MSDNLENTEINRELDLEPEPESELSEIYKWFVTLYREDIGSSCGGVGEDYSTYEMSQVIVNGSNEQEAIHNACVYIETIRPNENSDEPHSFRYGSQGWVVLYNKSYKNSVIKCNIDIEAPSEFLYVDMVNDI